jgi:hypothetical protein
MVPQLFSHNKQFKLDFPSNIIFSSKTDPKRLARRHDEKIIKSEIIKPDKGVTGPPDLGEQQTQFQTAISNPQPTKSQVHTAQVHAPSHKSTTHQITQSATQKNSTQVHTKQPKNHVEPVAENHNRRQHHRPPTTQIARNTPPKPAESPTC